MKKRSGANVSSRSSAIIAALAGRIASLIGPRGMRLVARFNKYVTNPVQRLWAARLSHMALIEHTGRKSGARYTTPVMAFVESGGLTVVLNYGAASDWVRNIQAAGGGVAVHRGRRYRLSDPRVVALDSAELPSAVRAVRTPSRSAFRASLVAE